MTIRSRLRSDESGVTLAELLVTIAIIGAAMVAIVGSMSTSILISDIHRKAATADTIMRSAAEEITNVDLTYVNCATSSEASYVAALPTKAGFTVTITAVRYWTGANPAAFQAACPSPDRGLQRLSLRVVSNDGRDTENLDVVKRRK